MSNAHKIWVEDYRPHKIEDCILPARIKSIFQQMISSGNIVNYAAMGEQGSGKTSSARALCEELNIDYIIINMSNESGIDTVRNKIVNFASSMSFKSDYKVIIMDEFDHANQQSAQPALRGVIEDHMQNCRFIMTGNIESKIIGPLFSRCPKIDFTFSKEEREEVLLGIVKRAMGILNENSIVYDKKDVINYCRKMFPDFRQIINDFQMKSINGELDLTGLGSKTTEKMSTLIDALKSQDFNKIKSWVSDNFNPNSGHTIRRALYDNIKEYVKADSVAEMILLINRYDYQEAHVVDKEVNMIAFLVECLINIEFN